MELCGKLIYFTIFNLFQPKFLESILVHERIINS